MQLQLLSTNKGRRRPQHEPSLDVDVFPFFERNRSVLIPKPFPPPFTPRPPPNPTFFFFLACATSALGVPRRHIHNPGRFFGCMQTRRVLEYVTLANAFLLVVSLAWLHTRFVNPKGWQGSAVSCLPAALERAGVDPAQLHVLQVQYAVEHASVLVRMYFLGSRCAATVRASQADSPCLWVFELVHIRSLLICRCLAAVDVK